MNIEQILNATLAGGVMMGSAADMIVSPFVSMCIGFSAGIVSTAGFHFFEHIIFKYLKLHDTCGVAYLHFVPGLLGGFIGCLVAGATGK
jgi:ammonium transporter Rh